MMRTIGADEILAECQRIVAIQAEGPGKAAMEKCGQPLREDFLENFASGGNEEVRWPEHAPLTVKLYGPHPLLILYEKLLPAVIEDDAAGHIEEATESELRIGVDGGRIKYAATHNYGDDSRNIPQREYLVPRQAGLDKCEQIIGDATIERID